ncbi:hypothetical protein [Desulfogranum mediterraneum]|uniref:hypothetical protein n=1 Tax=Desulfogranum mediterraneum TaxID=160661 RepID=UPI000409FA65|nr:hypothetical protein [Desulfogranum mediterraneum]
MDALLDTLWEYLAAGFSLAGDSLFSLLQHLHLLGPPVLISLLAVGTVLLTKLLNRLIITRRYLELEKIYHHWLQLRQEAMQCADRDKGSRMARNIDQAELNKAYYDYFFEGLLLGIARKVLPIFFVFAFINEYYRPEQMLELFGREYLLRLGTGSGEPILIGAVFWYFISLLCTYLCWSLAGALAGKVRTARNLSTTPCCSLPRTVEESKI